MMIFERAFVKRHSWAPFALLAIINMKTRFLPLVNIWQIQGFATGKFYQFLYEDLKVIEAPLFDWI